MKHAPTKNEETRFRGAVRHYHRSGARPNRTWDEWIDGEEKSRKNRKWLKISVVTIALLGLAGIIAALFIEMS
jgi:hypothetical protein